MSPTLRSESRMELAVFGWSLAFMILALASAILGFTDVAGRSVPIARTLFIVFLVVSLSGIVYRTLMGKRRFGS